VFHQLKVEGLSKRAIARRKDHARKTVKQYLDLGMVTPVCTSHVPPDPENSPSMKNISKPVWNTIQAYQVSDCYRRSGTEYQGFSIF